MLINTNIKPFALQQKQNNISFKGDKDIVVIDDYEEQVDTTVNCIKNAVGDSYNVYGVLGGEAGLVAVDKYKPKLTVTAYNMDGYTPDGKKLIKMLNNLNTNVIVYTYNWFGEGIWKIKEGVNTCEKKGGAKKYVFKSDTNILIDSVKAILNNEEPPRYDFQIAKEKGNESSPKFGKRIISYIQNLKDLITHKNKPTV